MVCFVGHILTVLGVTLKSNISNSISQFILLATLKYLGTWFTDWVLLPQTPHPAPTLQINSSSFSQL